MQNNLELGDIVLMKKNHACGGNRFSITRLGVDIKIKCVQCGHEIMMDRIDLMKKIKKKVGNENAKETK